MRKTGKEHGKYSGTVKSKKSAQIFRKTILANKIIE
jgi:hypothetical protein